jgi:DNA-binding transcriptional ArsR family regulator
MSKINLDKVSRIMKALSHPVRIKIVETLSNNGKMCVTDIYKTLNIEQSTASHHLGILKIGGILNCKREGKQIFYSLNNNNSLELLECIKKCSFN